MNFIDEKGYIRWTAQNGKYESFFGTNLNNNINEIP